MTYNQLIAYCARAFGIARVEGGVDLFAILRVLKAQDPTNRAIGAEIMVHYLTEFIEAGEKKDVDMFTKVH